MPPQLVYPHLRFRATQDEILIAIRDRLRSAIDVLNDSNCFVTDQPILLHVPNGAYCVTVAPGERIFPSEFFAGGGNATLTEQGSVIVTPMVCMKLDRPFRSELQPIGASATADVPDHGGWLGMQMVFAMQWDWETS